MSKTKKFRCTYCSKLYASSNGLSVHRKVHTGNCFKCRYCVKSFGQKKNLEMHILTHTGERPFPCPECPKRFRQVTTLNQHLRVHFNLRPFPCPHCPCKFKQVTTLNQHVRVHLNIRPYKCKECNQTFIQASNLREHEQNQHCSGSDQITGPRPRLTPRKKWIKAKRRRHNPRRVASSVAVVEVLKREPEMENSVPIAETDKLDQQMKDKKKENRRSLGQTEKPSPPPNNKAFLSKDEPPPPAHWHNGVKLNFTPIAYWFQCQICKVCISDKDKFLLHKETKHPPRQESDSEDSTSDEDVLEEEIDDVASPASVSATSEICVDLVSSSSSSSNVSDDEDVETHVEIQRRSPVVKIEPLSLSTFGERDTRALEQWKSKVFTKDDDDESTDLCTTVTDGSDASSNVTEEGVDKDLNTSQLPPPPITGRRRSSESNPGSLCRSVRAPKRRKTKDNEQEEQNISNGSGSSCLPEPEVPSLNPATTTTPSPLMEVEVEAEAAAVVDQDNNLEEVAGSSRKHSCCVCNKSFTYRANLNCHLSSAHLSKKNPEGQLVLKCGLCTKTFKSRKQLSVHSFFHTNEHRFKCPSCGESFLTKKNFQEHSKLCRTPPKPISKPTSTQSMAKGQTKSVQ